MNSVESIPPYFDNILSSVVFNPLNDAAISLFTQQSQTIRITTLHYVYIETTISIPDTHHLKKKKKSPITHCLLDGSQDLTMREKQNSFLNHTLS